MQKLMQIFFSTNYFMFYVCFPSIRVFLQVVFKEMSRSLETSRIGPLKFYWFQKDLVISYATFLSMSTRFKILVPLGATWFLSSYAPHALLTVDVLAKMLCIFLYQTYLQTFALVSLLFLLIFVVHLCIL